MGLFTGIESAQARKGAEYLEPGHYTCEVLCMKGLRNRSERPLAIFELKVLEASPGSGTPVGREVSDAVMLDRDGGLRDVRDRVAAITGTPFEQVDERACEMCAGERNPLRGAIVYVDAKHKPTKKGGVFTQVRYTTKQPPPALAKKS